MNDIKKQIFLALDEVWRRKRLALAVAWGICLVGWAFVATLPDQFVSEARFYVDTTSMLNPLLKGIAVSDDDKNRDQQVVVMQRTLTSRPNILKVAQMTDMDKSATTPGQLQELVTSLEDRIKVKSQGTNLFLVQFTDNSPTLARNVVQALLTIFVESSTGDKREDIQTARTFLDTQIADYEKQLKAAEQRMADFKVKNVDFVSFNAQSFGARLEQARQEAKDSKVAYEDAQEERDQIHRQLSATPQTLSLDSPINTGNGATPYMSSQQRILALESRLSDLKTQYTDKHPDVISTKAAIEKLRHEQATDSKSGSDSPSRAQMPNELYTQLAMKFSEAETRTNNAKRKYEEAQALVDRMQKSAAEAPRVEAELTNLDRDYQVLKSSYDNLLQRREYARIGAAADTTTQPVQFRLIAAPEVPVNASGPKRILFNTMVLLFGVVAGCGFVILLGRIDDHINSPEDLFDLPGFRLLGCVSPVKLGGLDYYPIPLMSRFGTFGVAAVGLAFMFLLIALASPNLGSYPFHFYAAVTMSNNIDLVGRLSERIDLNAGVRPSVTQSDPPPMAAQAGESLVMERTSGPATAIPAETVARAQEGPAPQSPTFELNLQELSTQGFLTPQNSNCLTAEEYRIIKRPLLRTAFSGMRKRGDRNHIVMVTSARPNDGKTFTALNLAFSIASERDIQVLLVDADMRRRGLSSTLAMIDKPGLMDVLTDGAKSIDTVIHSTNIPRLSIIPAGQKTNHPTEVFASRRTATVMREITERFADRFIILDTAPVLATSDSAVLASYVGQTIMVVLANETSKRAVIEFVAPTQSCPSVSFVLNKMAMRPGFERFGSYGDYT